MRRTHVIMPEQGGDGNCAHCPAHALECARREWIAENQDVVSIQSRVLGPWK